MSRHLRTVMRGGRYLPLRAYPVALLAALFDTSLDDFLVDPHERELPHHFQNSLRTARELLG